VRRHVEPKTDRVEGSRRLGVRPVQVVSDRKRTPFPLCANVQAFGVKDRSGRAFLMPNLDAAN